MKLKEIYWTQLSIEESRNLITKLMVGLRSLSILTDWALENGMETTFSMENRGYGSGRRTYYKPMSATINDIVAMLLYGVVTVLYFVTIPIIRVIPEISIEFSYANTLVVILIVGYCLIEDFIESRNKRNSVR